MIESNLAAQDSNSVALLEVTVPPVTVFTTENGQRIKETVAKENATRWLTVGDRVRIGFTGGANLTYTGNDPIKLGPEANYRVKGKEDKGLWASFTEGLFQLFFKEKHDQPIEVKSRQGAIEGTEVSIDADSDGALISVLEGMVSFSRSNQLPLRVAAGHELWISKDGELGEVSSMSTKTAIARIQWALHYPTIINSSDLRHLGIPSASSRASLDRYQTGDVNDALWRYPWSDLPRDLNPEGPPRPMTDLSPADRALLATLLVAGGNGRLLDRIPESGPDGLRTILRALTLLRAAVLGESHPVRPIEECSSSELLAHSYYFQSNGEIETALSYANAAITKDPSFGFAWRQKATLDFGSGRNGFALYAARKATQLNPGDAEAWVVLGFTLIAHSQSQLALNHFNRALNINPDLGKARLGRGLLRYRGGDIAGGRSDLIYATSKEPQHSFLRSYLARALFESGDTQRALTELDVASQLDPLDPTPWYFRALLNRTENRLNEGVRDLEISKSFNDKRGLYRSRFLLDKDLAARRANLAGLYREAGLGGWAAREASLGLLDDYSNPAMHAFFAQAYSSDRIGTGNFRYETASSGSHLMANLLGPVGSSILSPQVSQQEYAAMFDQVGHRIFSQSTIDNRRGWSQFVSQYGNFEDYSYSVDGFLNDSNPTLNRFGAKTQQLNLRLKNRLGNHMTSYLELQAVDREQNSLAGSIASERQQPNLILGGNHSTSPEARTLFLLSRFETAFTSATTSDVSFFLREFTLAGFDGRIDLPLSTGQATDYEFYSAEIQHIREFSESRLVFGGRLQRGAVNPSFRIASFDPSISGAIVDRLGNFTQNTQFEGDFDRASAYGYYQQDIPIGSTRSPIKMDFGLVFDHLSVPDDGFRAPFLMNDRQENQLSPKVGIMVPIDKTTRLRAAFTQSLGGFSFDNSVRIEPRQVAGIVQSFRSLAPVRLTGALAGEKISAFDLALDRHFNRKTFLLVEGFHRKSHLSMSSGRLAWAIGSSDSFISSFDNKIRFEETGLRTGVSRLLGDEFTIGIQYELVRSEYSRRFRINPDSSAHEPNHFQSGILQQISLSAHWNHESGLYAKLFAANSIQKRTHLSPGRSVSDVQLDLFGGYWFNRRRARIQLGIMNILGQQDRIQAIHVYARRTFPRTVTASLRFDI